MFRVRILLAAVLAVSVLAVLAGAGVGRQRPEPEVLHRGVEDRATTPAIRPRRSRPPRRSSSSRRRRSTRPPRSRAPANTIASVLGKIATIKPSNVADLAGIYTSKTFKTYPTAVGTFFSYSAQQCGT